MALSIKDGAAASQTIKTSTSGSDLVPHHNLDTIATGASADIGNSGSTTAITSDTTGSVIGFLRGLVKWAFERMPASLGQKTMANSLAVAIASDQSAIGLAAGSQSIGGVKLNGVQYTPTQTNNTSADASSTAIDLTSTPTSGQKIVIDDWIISVGATALLITIQDSDGNVQGKFYLAANAVCAASFKNGFRATNADKKLQVKTSAAGNVTCWSSWHSE